METRARAGRNAFVCLLFAMGRPAKKAKRAAQTAGANAANKAARAAADDGDGMDDDDGAAGAAAGAGVEPAVPPAGVGVPLGVPIEQIGQLLDESMTQREVEGDVTVEMGQTVDDAHGAGFVLGDPVGSQDSEGNDIFMMQAAEEEEAEAEAEAQAKRAADEAALQQQQQQPPRRPPPRRDRLDDDADKAMQCARYRAAQSQEDEEDEEPDLAPQRPTGPPAWSTWPPPGIAGATFSWLYMPLILEAASISWPGAWTFDRLLLPLAWGEWVADLRQFFATARLSQQWFAPQLADGWHLPADVQERLINGASGSAHWIDRYGAVQEQEASRALRLRDRPPPPQPPPPRAQPAPRSFQVCGLVSFPCSSSGCFLVVLLCSVSGWPAHSCTRWGRCD